MLKRSWIFALGLSLWLSHTVALALPELPASLGGPAKAEVKDDEGSPRYMFRQFLDVLNGDDVEAGQSYLEYPRRYTAERKRALVRKLFAVLNKKGRIDVNQLSKEATGRLNDGLSPELESIGQIELGRDSTPILLIQSTEEGKTQWRFAAEFVDKVPVLYEKIGETDIEALLPAILVEHQFLDIRAWQWLALGVSLFLAAAFSRLLALGMLKLLSLISERLAIDLPLDVSRGYIWPLRLLGGLMAFNIVVTVIDLGLNARVWIQYGTSTVLVVVLTILAMRIAESAIEMLRASFYRQGRPGATAMLLPAERGIKALIIVIAAVFLLRNYGFDVTALVAGLGVGGVAVALAGQKTLENLFGGISVILDQPVRVGDSGRFGDLVGTVEDIGLRSTRIRTLNRSVMTIPNAEFSHMKIENFERRDRFLFNPTLTIRFDTKVDQLRYLLVQLKELMLSHPMVQNEPARVRFVRFGTFALEIDIFAFIKTIEIDEYWAVVEDLNLRIMSIIAECGTDFAYPTTTMVAESAEKPDPDKQRDAQQRFQEMVERTGSPLPFYPPDWTEPKKDTLPFATPPRLPDLRRR